MSANEYVNKQKAKRAAQSINVNVEQRGGVVNANTKKSFRVPVAKMGQSTAAAPPMGGVAAANRVSVKANQYKGPVVVEKPRAKTVFSAGPVKKEATPKRTTATAAVAPVTVSDPDDFGHDRVNVVANLLDEVRMAKATVAAGSPRNGPPPK